MTATLKNIESQAIRRLYADEDNKLGGVEKSIGTEIRRLLTLLRLLNLPQGRNLTNIFTLSDTVSRAIWEQVRGQGFSVQDGKDMR